MNRPVTSCISPSGADYEVLSGNVSNFHGTIPRCLVYNRRKKKKCVVLSEYR